MKENYDSSNLYYMKIIHLASELAPVAKVGGLGDVVYGLARAFKTLGHDASVVIPRYAVLKTDGIENFRLYEETPTMAVWEGHVGGIHAYFLDIPGYFKGPSIYGSQDEAWDFIHFSSLAYKWIMSKKERPDLLHLHDWHVGAIALFAQGEIPTVSTIHNISYQGIASASLLERVHYKASDFPGIEEGTPDVINLMKGLILYSDRVNTVSPTYAWEVTHTEEGRGLQEALKTAGDRFCGILNGIDYDYWNPKDDRYLLHPYSASNINPKKLLKQELRDKLGLENSLRPLIGMVSRLVVQKGIHLMEHAILHAEEYNAQIVLSGAAYDEETIAMFKRLQERFDKSPHVRVVLGYSESLAHELFAGADMFLIPSIFEPCGLTQLISLRYGTVPIVRHTGGLADTIVDVHHSDKPLQDTNGFSFKDPVAVEMDSTIKRAVNYWYSQPKEWSALQKRGMLQDFSWKHSAQQYLDLYCSL